MISTGADEIKVVSSCYLNLNKQRVTVLLALHFAMSLNVQTHFKNITAFAARFLKCVWPFYDIAK